MKEALEKVKQLRTVGSMMESDMEQMPLMKKLIMEVASNDPQTKLLLDMLEGHVPNLQDLLELNHLHDHMNTRDAIRAAVQNDQQFQQFSSLMSKPDFESSLTDLQQSFFLLTGKHLDLSSVMVKDLRNPGMYRITPSADNQYRNLMECMVTIKDNFNKFMGPILDKSVRGNVYSFFLQASFDATHLSQISDFKYSVGGVPTTDPDVTELIQLLKKGKVAINSKKSSYVEGVDTVSEVFSKLLNIFSKSMQQAVSANTQVVG